MRTGLALAGTATFRVLTVYHQAPEEELVPPARNRSRVAFTSAYSAKLTQT